MPECACAKNFFIPAFSFGHLSPSIDDDKSITKTMLAGPCLSKNSTRIGLPSSVTRKSAAWSPGRRRPPGIGYRDINRYQGYIHPDHVFSVLSRDRSPARNCKEHCSRPFVICSFHSAFGWVHITRLWSRKAWRCPGLGLEVAGITQHSICSNKTRESSGKPLTLISTITVDRTFV